MGASVSFGSLRTSGVAAAPWSAARHRTLTQPRTSLALGVTVGVHSRRAPRRLEHGCQLSLARLIANRVRGPRGTREPRVMSCVRHQDAGERCRGLRIVCHVLAIGEERIGCGASVCAVDGAVSGLRRATANAVVCTSRGIQRRQAFVASHERVYSMTRLLWQHFHTRTKPLADSLVTGCEF